MQREVTPNSAEREELERDAAGFRFLSPNGIYNIAPDLEDELEIKSSFRESRAVSKVLDSHRD